MAYLGTLVYAAGVYQNGHTENVELDYNDVVYIHGRSTRALYPERFHNLIIYVLRDMPDAIKKNKNRIASKLYNKPIYGDVIIVDETIEEVPNEDADDEGGEQYQIYDDEEGGDEYGGGYTDCEEPEDAYVTKRKDFTAYDLAMLCSSVGI
jgi:hypothetical protein